MNFGFNTCSFLATFLLLLTFVTSCRKNPESQPGPGNPPARRLVKIEEGLNSSFFEYNNDSTLRKIITIIDDGNGPEEFSESFSYYADKKIAEVVSENSTKLIFHYENGRLKLIDRINRFGERSSYSEYLWQENNLRTLNTYLKDNTGQGGGNAFLLVFKLEYTYYTDNNLRQVSGFARDMFTGQLVPTGTEKFEAYDNKINPLAALKTYALSRTEIIGRHNHIRKLRYDENNLLVETIETTYTYDQNGYPVSSVEKHKPHGLLPFYLNYKYTYQ